MLRRTCGDYARMLPSFAYEAAGAAKRPALPAPSVFLRVTNLHQPGHQLCCGMRGRVLGCWLFEKSIGEARAPVRPPLEGGGSIAQRSGWGEILLDNFAQFAPLMRAHPPPPGEVGLRTPGQRFYPAPTAFLRQARCTAQVQPGGCERNSFASISLAGAAENVGSFGIASRNERSCVDWSCEGM